MTKNLQAARTSSTTTAEDFDCRVQAEWRWVRRNIYEGWDLNDEWRLASAAEWGRLPWPEAAKASVLGLCDLENKVIYLNSVKLSCLDRDRVRAVLVHEIAHYYVKSHDRYFQEILEIALRQVERAGGSERLTLILTSDIEDCKRRFDMNDYRTPEEIISSYFIRCGYFYPFLSFAETIKTVFGGGFPPSFIRRKFPKALHWHRKSRRRGWKELAVKAARMQAAAGGRASND